VTQTKDFCLLTEVNEPSLLVMTHKVNFCLVFSCLMQLLLLCHPASSSVHSKVHSLVLKCPGYEHSSVSSIEVKNK